MTRGVDSSFSLGGAKPRNIFFCQTFQPQRHDKTVPTSGESPLLKSTRLCCAMRRRRGGGRPNAKVETTPSSFDALQIVGCKDDVVGPIIRGSYTLQEKNHDRPVFRKDEKAGVKQTPRGCGAWGLDLQGPLFWALTWRLVFTTESLAVPGISKKILWVDTLAVARSQGSPQTHLILATACESRECYL